MPPTFDQNERQKELEFEIELEKSRLSEAIQGSIREIENLFLPDSLPRLVLGSLVKHYPLPTLALLFAGGALTSQLFYSD